MRHNNIMLRPRDAVHTTAASIYLRPNDLGISGTTTIASRFCRSPARQRRRASVNSRN